MNEISELSDSMEGLDSLVEDSAPGSPPCLLITGRAGTGKTTLVQRTIADDPQWALLTSTTGISAVNLGAVTLNSALGYFDDNSLLELFHSGRLAAKLRKLRQGGTRNLLVEEASMLTGTALDTLYRGCEQAAGARDEVGATLGPLGLVLVADFCQLPPVKGKWAFEASCWDKFQVQKLVTVWRQEQLHFLEVLDLVRRGSGAEAATLLKGCGTPFATAKSMDFDGTTIVAKNDEVAAYNLTRLDRLAGASFKVRSQRWGDQRNEWKQRRVRQGSGWRMGEWGIPPEQEFKVGAYVMCLSNSGADLEYANGDCGHVEQWDEARQEMTVRLVRGGRKLVTVGRIARSVEQEDKPSGAKDDSKLGGYVPKVRRNTKGDKWVTGQVEYLPVRLAWATSVHKSQSLTLDKVQVDFRDRFFTSPGMLYTALSRCRTLEGLRLVGQPEVLARHAQCDPKVRSFL